MLNANRHEQPQLIIEKTDPVNALVIYSALSDQEARDALGYAPYVVGEQSDPVDKLTTTVLGCGQLAIDATLPHMVNAPEYTEDIDTGKISEVPHTDPWRENLPEEEAGPEPLVIKGDDLKVVTELLGAKIATTQDETEAKILKGILKEAGLPTPGKLPQVLGRLGTVVAQRNHQKDTRLKKAS